MKIDGGCYCGSIQYEADIDPANVSICHCKDCQQFTGSAYRVTVLLPAGSLTLTRGAPKTFIKTADNGNRSVQHFCGECGSPLFYFRANDPSGQWGIRWGSIRQRDQLAPQRQIWMTSAAPWAHDLTSWFGEIAD